MKSVVEAAFLLALMGTTVICTHTKELRRRMCWWEMTLVMVVMLLVYRASSNSYSNVGGQGLKPGLSVIYGGGSSQSGGIIDPGGLNKAVSIIVGGGAGQGAATYGHSIAQGGNLGHNFGFSNVQGFNENLRGLFVTPGVGFNRRNRRRSRSRSRRSRRRRCLSSQSVCSDSYPSSTYYRHQYQDSSHPYYCFRDITETRIYPTTVVQREVVTSVVPPIIQTQTELLTETNYVTKAKIITDTEYLTQTQVQQVTETAFSTRYQVSTTTRLQVITRTQLNNQVQTVFQTVFKTVFQTRTVVQTAVQTQTVRDQVVRTVQEPRYFTQTLTTHFPITETRTVTQNQGQYVTVTRTNYSYVLKLIN
nr:uncharacterized protein LOC128704919 [Cherax quadricarinatus]